MRNRKSFNIVTVRNRSCGKVMFSQASVILPEGGGMCGRGACMAGGVYGRECVWSGCGREVVHGRGGAWQGAWGVRGRGLVVCVAGGHAWQER